MIVTFLSKTEEKTVCNFIGIRQWENYTIVFEDKHGKIYRFNSKTGILISPEYKELIADVYDVSVRCF